MKRFTDTEKWNKKFVRSLKPAYKLLWFFICDECNSGGIWDVDIEVAQLKTGVKFTESEALKVFGENVVPIENGKKWFITTFSEFQYGELSHNNRAHIKAIQVLTKYNLLTESLKIKPLTRGLIPSLGGSKVEEEVMVEEKEEVERTPFQKFESWILKNAKRVSQMGEPFTLEEYERLVDEFSPQDVKDVLTAMHNNKDLLKKNISANLTFRNWATRRGIKKVVQNHSQQTTEMVL